MSSSKRIVVLFALALAVPGAAGLLVLQARENVIATAREVTRTYEILGDLDGLLTDVLDAETGQRGFVITGEERYLEPFHRAHEQVPGRVAALDAGIRDASARALLEALSGHVDRKMTLAREVVGLRRSAGREEASSALQARRGKETMDEIRVLVGAIRARERELLAERTARAQEHARFAAHVFLGGLAVSGSLLLGVIVLLLREAGVRLATERELRRHAAVSDGVLANMVDGVVVADREGAVILMNRAAEAMLGRGMGRAAKLAGTLPALYRADAATAVPAEEAPLSRALQGESVHDLECAMRTPGRAAEEAEPTWLSISAQPIAASDGARLGAVAVLRDVTHAKLAEQALRESNERLRRSVDALERRNGEVSLLAELSALLQACLDESEASAVIAQSLPRLLPGSCGAAYLLDAGCDQFVQACAWGPAPPIEPSFAADDCWALRRGRMHVLDDRRLGLRCRHVAGAVRDAVCLPFLAHGETLGVLHLRDVSGLSGIESAGDGRDLLAAVADEIGLALANLRLRDSLRQESIRDPLTELFNRRYMEESFEREMLRAARQGTPIGVLMIDVDHFKRFNDTLGHDAGDALLRDLGRLLRAGVRGDDLACRYGGEEFVVLLPGAGREDSLRRAEALRDAARGLVPSRQDRTVRAVTLSIGVALYPEHGHDPRTLVQAADRALYQAKHAGRDRVVLAETPLAIGADSAA